MLSAQTWHCSILNVSAAGCSDAWWIWFLAYVVRVICERKTRLLLRTLSICCKTCCAVVQRSSTGVQICVGCATQKGFRKVHHKRVTLNRKSLQNFLLAKMNH